MSHKKCRYCRHQKADHCTRLNKPCAEAQDDSEFDKCGVCMEDPAWDLRTYKDKATKKKIREDEVMEQIEKGRCTE